MAGPPSRSPPEVAASLRRCKQFLAHRYAHVPADAGTLTALVTALVTDLEVVPYGHGPRQEALLGTAVAAAGGRLRRDIRAKAGTGEAAS